MSIVTISNNFEIALDFLPRRRYNPYKLFKTFLKYLFPQTIPPKGGPSHGDSRGFIRAGRRYETADPADP